MSAEQQTQATTQPSIKRVHRQRHFLAAFFLSFMWGSFGVDRFYLGKVWTGILKLITFGGLGLWTLIDFILIMSGSMKDKQGQPLLQAAEYKKFAVRTVLWFAIILGLVILINGLIGIYFLTQLVTQLQDGLLNGLTPDLNGLVPEGSNIDINQIKDSLDLQQLGL